MTFLRLLCLLTTETTALSSPTDIRHTNKLWRKNASKVDDQSWVEIFIVNVNVRKISLVSLLFITSDSKSQVNCLFLHFLPKRLLLSLHEKEIEREMMMMSVCLVASLVMCVEKGVGVMLVKVDEKKSNSVLFLHRSCKENRNEKRSMFLVILFVQKKCSSSTWKDHDALLTTTVVTTEGQRLVCFVADMQLQEKGYKSVLRDICSNIQLM